jgi:hypothetical protein
MSTPPAGVSPLSWDNPTWQAIWKKQNPGYGQQLLPGNKPVVNPGVTGTPYTPEGPGFESPAKAPAVVDANAPPAGVNPLSWANPTWRWIWMQQHPGYSPSVTPAAPGTPATPEPPGFKPAASPAGTQAGTGFQKWTPPAWSGGNPTETTVQGQLEGLLDPSNPLMQRARTGALQQMNASGRQNSSMATTAADAAMYDTALQIATPDAQNAFAYNFAQTQNQFDLFAQQLGLSSQEKQQMTATLGGLYSSINAEIGQILQNKDLDGAGMQAALDKIWSGYQDTITTFADLFGYDFTSAV